MSALEDVENAYSGRRALDQRAQQLATAWRTSADGAVHAEKLFTGTSIILTAGGSAAFDIVARELPLRLSRPALTILRSGCYVTHDSGFYARMLEGVKLRSGPAWQAPGVIWYDTLADPGEIRNLAVDPTTVIDRKSVV